jgi:hypothetical protein
MPPVPPAGRMHLLVIDTRHGPAVVINGEAGLLAWLASISDAISRERVAEAARALDVETVAARDVQVATLGELSRRLRRIEAGHE